MKKMLMFTCLIATVIVSSFTKVKASHCVGADLTYTNVNSNTIHLRLRFYRDCSGIPAPSTGDIRISAALCSQQPFYINMPLVSAYEIVTSDCIDTTALTTCHPLGTRYGVEEYVYEQDVTLPMVCNDWLFEFELCCRNVNSTFLTGGYSFYISTTYDNLNGLLNNSPQFLSYPVTSLCIGNPFTYFQNGFDPDGDSLVYSLVNAQGSGGLSMTYISPYSGTNPLSSATPITIAATSGQISLTPNLLMYGQIVVLIEEFRNGIKIGSVKRDIQVEVGANCNPYLIPQYNQQAILSGINVHCGTYDYDIPFNLQLQCNTIGNDDFRAVNSLGLPIPITSITPVNCIGGYTDSVHIVMTEPFTSGINYVYTKTGADGNTILGQCGFSIPAYDTIKFILNDTTPWQFAIDTISCQQNGINIHLSDYVYCYTVDHDASSLQLIDAGNGNAVIPIASSYTYCGPSGDSLSNKLLINLPANQSLTGPLYLIAQIGTDNNTIARSCGGFFNNGDTIAVLYVKNGLSISLGQDIDACANSNELPVELNSGYGAGGSISFQWYFNGSIINGANASAYYANDSGLYEVIAYASVNCQGSDSVIVNVINTNEIKLGSDRNICIGDAVQLDMGNGGMIYQWFFDGWAEDQDTFPIYNAMYDGEYIGLSITYGQNGHLCFGSDTVNVTTWPYPEPILSNQTVCATMLPYVIDAGNTGASYLWLAELLDTIQTYTAYGTGTYVVTITNFPGCSIQDSMTLTIENQLDEPILDCSTISGGGYTTVYSWSDVSGNAGYEISFDSINWVQANTPVSPTSHGTNSFSTTVYVRAIMTGLCAFGKSSSPFDCNLNVPNIITPNGDGQNDAFIIANISLYPNNTFRIMNRWGIEVYAEKGYNNTSKVFTGDGLPPDKYFYTLDFGNGVDRKAGTLTISK